MSTIVKSFGKAQPGMLDFGLRKIEEPDNETSWAKERLFFECGCTATKPRLRNRELLGYSTFDCQELDEELHERAWKSRPDWGIDVRRLEAA